MKKFNLDELTPVEKITDNFYVKREDLFMPFDDVPLSGSKVRQCIALVQNNYDYIKNECDGNIYTATSVTSPQGIIVSRVAKEFGFKCKLFIYGTKIKENNLLMNSLNLGAEINNECKIGYESALTSLIHKQTEKHFHIKFGINLEEDKSSILDTIANQVQNVPKDLDYLIIPCGSCITMCGIIMGLQKYNVNVKHVIGIQIAGYDRTKTINNILNNYPLFNNFDYELRLSKDFPYSKKVNYKINDIQLDPIYEGKAYYFMQNSMGEELKDKKTLFWIVGNSNMVRNKVYNEF